jgi:hypothetical protein
MVLKVLLLPAATSVADPWSASKNLSILIQKNVSKLSEIWSGLFIPDPDPDLLPIPDPGAKKAPDPGSGSATLAAAVKNNFNSTFMYYRTFHPEVVAKLPEHFYVFR